MARVLVTGMSGAGKSTLLRELARRGHPVVDTDLDAWTSADGLWDEPRMTRLLAGHPVIAVGGTAENQARFAFDHVVLLSAPLAVLLARVTARSDNPYGSTAAQRAEIAHYTATVEPLLRAHATLEIDTSVTDAGATAVIVDALVGGRR